MKKEYVYLFFFCVVFSLLFCTELSFSQSPAAIPQKQKNSDSEKNIERVGNMVKIPAGFFWMGRNTREGFSNENPFHPVYLNEYWIDVNEVTILEYTEFLNAGGNDDHYNPLMRDEKTCGIIRNPDGSYSCLIDRRDYPVTDVTWGDAQAYAQWIGKRLPTEAEWECAARGGLKGKKYGAGNTISHNAVNYSSGRKKLFGRYTSPVGAYPPNEYGIYDMSGNVWEWVQDYFNPNFYKPDTMFNPVNSTEKGISSRYRVIRGGSYVDDAEKDSYLRVSCRGPNYPIPDNWSNRIGFRCVSSVMPKEEKQRSSVDSAIDSLRMYNPGLYKNLTEDSLKSIILQNKRPADFVYESGIKSMTKAVAFSAVLPGSGEFYSKRWTTGIVFLSVEIASWILAFSNYSKAGKIDVEYKSFGDTHFDYNRYDTWLMQYREAHSGNNPPYYGTIQLPVTVVILSRLTGYIFIEEENKSFPQYENYYEIRKLSEFYAYIAKYDLFMPGWDDYISKGDASGKSENREEYKSVRNFRAKQKNDYEKMAKNALLIVSANHLASIFDTILGIKRNTIYRSTGWSWDTSNHIFNGYVIPSLNFRYKW